MGMGRKVIKRRVLTSSQLISLIIFANSMTVFVSASTRIKNMVEMTVTVHVI